jgi:hypothetical protein
MHVSSELKISSIPRNLETRESTTAKLILDDLDHNNIPRYIDFSNPIRCERAILCRPRLNCRKITKVLLAEVFQKEGERTSSKIKKEKRGHAKLQINYSAKGLLREKKGKKKEL